MAQPIPDPIPRARPSPALRISDLMEETRPQAPLVCGEKHSAGLRSPGLRGGHRQSDGEAQTRPQEMLSRGRTTAPLQMLSI